MAVAPGHGHHGPIASGGRPPARTIEAEPAMARPVGRWRGLRLRQLMAAVVGLTLMMSLGLRGAEINPMDYDIRLEQVGSRPLAVVRRRARPEELSRVVPEACGIVWGVVRARQIQGAGRNVAVYLDDQINLEVGVELDAPFAGDGEVVGSTLPSGSVATTIHHGPYQSLHHAHEAIRLWCRDNGRTLAGPSWEIYGHWAEEWNSDPSLITTEVGFLIADGSPTA